MFYIKNKDSFVNTRAAVNIMRSCAENKNKTPEDWFLFLSGWERPPVCRFCDINSCGFVSLSDGFKEWCNSSVCMKKGRTEANAKIGKLKELKTMWGDLLRESDDPRCVMCNEVINSRISFSKNMTCSKVCSSRFSLGYAKYRDDIIRDEDIHETAMKMLKECRIPSKVFSSLKPFVKSKRHFLDGVRGLFPIKQSTELTDSQDVRFCEHTKEHVFLSAKSSSFFKYLEDFGITKYEEQVRVLEQFAPDCVERCKHCGNVVSVLSSGIRSTKNPVERKFCSHEHYSAYMIEHPDEYEKTAEQLKSQSETMIAKIREGSFTPNVTNSWTRSDPIEVDGIKFKSSWESIFYRIARDDARLEYETFRISYIDELGKTRNYLVDFVDNLNKILYEVKPIGQYNRKSNKNKLESALRWCSESGYKFVHIGEWWFIENIDALAGLRNITEKERKAVENFKRNVDNEQYHKPSSCKVDQTDWRFEGS